jgi:hypothetical protein
MYYIPLVQDRFTGAFAYNGKEYKVGEMKITLFRYFDDNQLFTQRMTHVASVCSTKYYQRPTSFTEAANINVLSIQPIEEFINVSQSRITQAVHCHGRNLQHVHDENKTQELCNLAVFPRIGGICDPWSITYIPDKFRTPAMCLYVVQCHGLLIKRLTEAQQTPDVCLAAIKHTLKAIQFVKTPTHDLVMFALKQDPMILCLIQNEFKSRDLCLFAVQQNGDAIKYVPTKERDFEMWHAAVKQNGISIRFKKLPAGENFVYLCDLAIMANPMALQFIPKKQRSPTLRKKAIEKNGNAIQFIKYSAMYPALCLTAVCQNGLSLKHIPESKQTEELCIAAIKEDSRAIEYVKKQTLRLVMVSCYLWPGYLYHYHNIPKEFIDHEYVNHSLICRNSLICRKTIPCETCIKIKDELALHEILETPK